MGRTRFRFATMLVAATFAVSGCAAPARHGRARRPAPPGGPDTRPATGPSPSMTPSPSSASQGVRRVGWAIQVGAFPELGNAKRLAARLQEQGVDAFNFRKDKRFFTVRLGDFPTRASAEAEARRLEASAVISDWLVAPPVGGAAPSILAASPGSAGIPARETDLGSVATSDIPG